MLEQKGKKFNLILISGSGKGSFHISKNGIKNPLIKKNEWDDGSAIIAVLKESIWMT